MIDITDDAVRQLARIGEYVERMGQRQKFYPDAYTAAVESWCTAQTRVWNLLAGGGKLWGDSDYSLTLVTSYGMTVGVVWFRDRNFDVKDTGADSEGRPTWLADICMMHKAPLPASGVCARATDESKCFGVEVPIPGTWSLHS